MKILIGFVPWLSISVLLTCPSTITKTAFPTTKNARKSPKNSWIKSSKKHQNFSMSRKSFSTSPNCQGKLDFPDIFFKEALGTRTTPATVGDGFSRRQQYLHKLHKRSGRRRVTTRIPDDYVLNDRISCRNIGLSSVFNQKAFNKALSSCKTSLPSNGFTWWIENKKFFYFPNSFQ